MKHRTLAILLAAIAIVALSATAVMAAKPANATGHGAAVSEVAKAVHTVSGNAHGRLGIEGLGEFSF